MNNLLQVTLCCEEKSFQERSPLFVSCPNLWKQKAGEEWSTRAYWGPVPRRRQHTEGVLFCQLPPCPCHQLAAPGSHTWAGTDKTHSHLTPKITPISTTTTAVPCSLCAWQALHALPNFPLGTGLAANLECTRLFRSTRGLQCCCSTGLRAGCSPNTTVCYCC